MARLLDTATRSLKASPGLWLPALLLACILVVACEQNDAASENQSSQATSESGSNAPDSAVVAELESLSRSFELAIALPEGLQKVMEVTRILEQVAEFGIETLTSDGVDGVDQLFDLVNDGSGASDTLILVGLRHLFLPEKALRLRHGLSGDQDAWALYDAAVLRGASLVHKRLLEDHEFRDNYLHTVLWYAQPGFHEMVMLEVCANFAVDCLAATDCPTAEWYGRNILVIAALIENRDIIRMIEDGRTDEAAKELHRLLRESESLLVPDNQSLRWNRRLFPRGSDSPDPVLQRPTSPAGMEQFGLLKPDAIHEEGGILVGIIRLAESQ